TREGPRCDGQVGEQVQRPVLRIRYEVGDRDGKVRLVRGRQDQPRLRVYLLNREVEALRDLPYQLCEFRFRIEPPHEAGVVSRAPWGLAACHSQSHHPGGCGNIVVLRHALGSRSSLVVRGANSDEWGGCMSGVALTLSETGSPVAGNNRKSLPPKTVSSNSVPSSTTT